MGNNRVSNVPSCHGDMPCLAHPKIDVAYHGSAAIKNLEMSVAGCPGTDVTSVLNGDQWEYPSIMAAFRYHSQHHLHSANNETIERLRVIAAPSRGKKSSCTQPPRTRAAKMTRSGMEI